MHLQKPRDGGPHSHYSPHVNCTPFRRGSGSHHCQPMCPWASQDLGPAPLVLLLPTISDTWSNVAREKTEHHKLSGSHLSADMTVDHTRSISTSPLLGPTPLDAILRWVVMSLPPACACLMLCACAFFLSRSLSANCPHAWVPLSCACMHAMRCGLNELAKGGSG